MSRLLDDGSFAVKSCVTHGRIACWECPRSERKPITLEQVVIAYANDTGNKQEAVEALERAGMPLAQKLRISIAVERSRARRRGADRGRE